MKLEKLQAWTRITEGRFVAYYTNEPQCYKVKGFANGFEADKYLKELEAKLVANGYRMYMSQDGYHLFQKAA